MKILILSNYPWKNNNSFGNTYSSIFGKVPNTEIAHIYMFDGNPDYVPNVTKYYQIPECDVIKSLFSFFGKKRAGKRVVVSEVTEGSNTVNNAKPTSLYNKLLSLGKRHHWGLMFLARELAWKFGHVNYDGMMDFVNEFKPDIFFLPYSNVYYTNRIALYIKRHYDIPMVTEMEMDHYSLKRVSWNPIFWLDRFGKRKMIRKLVGQSEMMYAISQKLRDELEESLKIPCKVLYKTPDLNKLYIPYNRQGNQIKFLFTGNIYANRWKSLAMLAHCLEEEQIGRFDIYTSTPLSKGMRRALNIPGISEIHPPVSQNEVVELQNSADVLVHAEAFDKYNKSLVRCAISTKIMDYLCVGRCVLAIGPSDISSIEYLADNDVALVADSKQHLAEIVTQIKNNKEIISKYAAKGRHYVEKEFDENKIRSAFYNELKQISDNYSYKS